MFIYQHTKYDDMSALLKQDFVAAQPALRSFESVAGYLNYGDENLTLAAPSCSPEKCNRVDDGNGNGGGVILIGEGAAPEQARACRCEIFGTDADGVGLGPLSGGNLIVKTRNVRNGRR
jgi:hypothetical protein